MPALDPSAGSVIVDGVGVILAFDRNMERLTGWDAHEVVGQPKDLGLYSAPDDEGVRRFVPRPLYAGALPPTPRATTVRLALTRRDGALLDVEAVVSPLAGPGARQQVDIRRVLTRVGPGAGEERDPLTRLPSGAQLMAELASQFELARTTGRPLALLHVDVDHLDAINREHGRDCGDAVLRDVGGILSACVRESDLVARFDNDDFGVLLANTGRSDARHVAGRIRAAVETFIVPGAPPGALALTVSIGAACAPADADSANELLRRASEALDEVRRLGRNRVWCYARRPRVKVDVPVYFDGPSGHLLGTARDLSNSGVFVACRDPLPMGMRVGMQFRLPGQDQPVRIIGRVVRQMQRGVGIEFERYGAEDRFRLDTFVHASRADQ